MKDIIVYLVVTPISNHNIHGWDLNSPATDNGFGALPFEPHTLYSSIILSEINVCKIKQTLIPY